MTMIRAEEIKAAVASYWRYARQCPVVALEVDSQLHAWADEPADVLVLNKNRQLIEVEVKLTVSDLKRDAKKKKHRLFRETYKSKGQIWLTPTYHFHFAVPRDIANKVKPICDELFPYAGILACNGLYSPSVDIYRNPKPLCGRRLNATEALRMVRGQSATVCRLATRIEELLFEQAKLQGQLKGYKDKERLEALVSAPGLKEGEHGIRR